MSFIRAKLSTRSTNRILSWLLGFLLHSFFVVHSSCLFLRAQKTNLSAHSYTNDSSFSSYPLVAPRPRSVADSIAPRRRAHGARRRPKPAEPSLHHLR